MTIIATALLAAPFTETTMFPLAAPLGNANVIVSLLHAVTAIGEPFSETVLEFWESPNDCPFKMTIEPTEAWPGITPLITGDGGRFVTEKEGDESLIVSGPIE